MNLDVKFSGGKAFKELAFVDRAFMKAGLTWAGKVLHNRVVYKGRSTKGEPFPAYSYRWAARKKRKGQNPDKVNYNYTGDMWRSLKGSISAAKKTRGQGVLKFTGTAKTEKGKKRQHKQVKKSGEVVFKNTTRPAIAAILAFRQSGKPMPKRAPNTKPRFEFMGLSKKEVARLEKKYAKHLEKQYQRTPELFKGELSR